MENKKNMSFSKKEEIAPPKKAAKADSIKKVFALLRNHTEHDFSNYKYSTITRSIIRRMGITQIESMDDYIHHLQVNPDELDLLFRELLIGVTNFFRDANAFDSLKENAIMPILKNREPSDIIRAWIPACSTGEEAYSIAMIFQEAMEELDKGFEIRVFATDIDEDAIEFADAGVYMDGITTDVSPERLQRFFSRIDSRYIVRKFLRDMLTFATQNIIKDPPFSRIDLLSCRNLLIYMNEYLQKKILPLFHYSLKKDGYLFLGLSESIGGFGDYFEVIDRKHKIFRNKTESNDTALH